MTWKNEIKKKYKFKTGEKADSTYQEYLDSVKSTIERIKNRISNIPKRLERVKGITDIQRKKMGEKDEQLQKGAMELLEQQIPLLEKLIVLDEKHMEYEDKNL